MSRRRGLLVGGAVVAVLLAILFLSDPTEDRYGRPPLDPRGTGPEGTAALVDLLRQEGADVRIGLPDDRDDVVLLAVKGQDTVGALEQVRAAGGDGAVIVCLQNGVANEREALRRFADVYGVVVFCPAVHLEPGVVQASAVPLSGILDVGRYPSSQEGLQSLQQSPGNAPGWEGPYLKKDVPRDPWGNPYQYKSPGDHGEYDLASLGSDGAQGGDGEASDVTSWAGEAKSR